MATERVYTIPLRKEWLKAPKHNRAKRSVSAVRHFLQRHMKTEDVKLGTALNKKLWERGIKNPPHKVKVNAVKDGDTTNVELFGVKLEDKKGVAPKPAAKADEVKAALEGKDVKEETKEAKPEEKKEAKKETPKEVKAEEAKK